MATIRGLKLWLFLGFIMSIMGAAPLIYAQTNIFPADGNAGIGTMTPATAFEIRSNLNSMSWGSPSSVFGELTFSGPTNKAILRAKSGQDLSLGGNNSFDQLFIEGATGKVGIGTTTPGSALEIRSNFNSMSWGSPSSVFGELTFSGPANKAILRAKSGQDLSLGANNSFDQLFIQGTTGKVGIGTTTPGAALEIRSSANSIRWGSPSSVFGELTFNGPANKAIIRAKSGQNLSLGANNAIDQLFIHGATGNVGIGTRTPAAKFHVAGDVRVDGNIGAKYQDIAEWVPTPISLPAGTVVMIDPVEGKRVIATSQPYDTRIAGVVSSQPGIILGEAGNDKIKVAHSGRVKTKADAQYGAIKTGDLLVSSGTSGYAMRSTPVDVNGISMHRPGTIIGKALEPLADGRGEILVLVTLQ